MAILFYQTHLNLILVNLFLIKINAHPAPSPGICHGLQLNTAYDYFYKTTIQLNNNDHLGKEPIGFKFQSHITFCNIWQNENNFILQAKLSKDEKFKTLKDTISTDPSNTKQFHNDEEQYSLYAHIFEDKNIRNIVSFYEHNQDTTTNVNLKRAIVRLFRTKPSNSKHIKWTNSGQEIIESFDSVESEEQFESMLKPEKYNKYEIIIKLNRDHSFVTNLNGWQNISMASRLYKEAHSKFHSTFELSLKGEGKCDSEFTQSLSLNEVLAKLETEPFVKINSAQMSREKQPCHNCKHLDNLIFEMKDTLTEDKSASLDSSLSFLAIVERIRSSGPGAGKQEILNALNKAAKDNKINYKSPQNIDQYPPEILSSLLDHCAASRTEPALEAALEHLDLPTNNNLDIAERFLVTSSVSFMTLATTNAANSIFQGNVNSAHTDHTNIDTNHIYLIEKLLQLLRNHQWSSFKLKWATQLALGNLIKCHNILLSAEVLGEYNDLNSLSTTLDQFALDENLIKQNNFKMQIDNIKERNLINIFSDDLNVKVINYLLKEYENCKDTDCREVLLVSLGGTGNLVLAIDNLEKVASQSKLRREQVSSLKALKECLEFNFKHNPVNQIIKKNNETSKLIQRLNYNNSGLHNIIYDKIKKLLASVVYNSGSETTSRILAAELIAKYFSDDVQLINSLIRNMLHFNNFELTTLMWIKMQNVWQQKQKKSIIQGEPTVEELKNCAICENQIKHLNNWMHAPNVLNGSSTLFNRPLGCSSTMNATYGISMELLSAGRLLKETNFDIGLEGLRDAEQSLFGVSIFARGLSSFSGSDDSNDELAEEETQAGMSLRVLNVQLRPYTFFKSKSELMSHFWSGTGSNPTPIFRGNFLVADHNQAIGLLNGFVLEEKMHAVLSLDALGQVSISLWNRNSHSVVTANSALLIRGSHSVTSSQNEAYIEQRFAFGGNGRIEFVTDTDFYNTPFKMCLQITQPKFNIRHNTRKYEKVNADQITRRIHRRNYEIPAKSYPLHKDNNLMCAAMNIED